MNLAGEDIRGNVTNGGPGGRRPRHLELIERYAEEIPEALMADGFDEGLIGRAFRGGDPILIYDYEKCVDVLMDRDGMGRGEAVEYMDFNVVGAVIEGGPLFLEE